jgi:MPBQ/MSBQ methyltransferase
MSGARLPAYLDGLIAAYRAGQAGRNLHLGYWDRSPEPSIPVLPGEFEIAQQRFTERVVDLLELQTGERAIDIGCGLGGVLEALAVRIPGVALFGVNIDPRQLALCRDIVPPTNGSLALIAADACAAPFAADSFDRVLAIEAMFHFRSRRAFLAEAARLLRPGGRLLVTDVLLQEPKMAAPWSIEAMAAALRRDYGPWPELWIESAQLRRWAAEEGLDLVAAEDWTAATLASYRIIAPPPEATNRRHPDAGSVLRWLHHCGGLTYQVLIFKRRRRQGAFLLSPALPP